MAEINKVALITGAGTGVGKAAALALAGKDYAIVLAGRRKEPIDDVAKEIEALGSKALAVQSDIGDPASVENLFAKTKETFGRLDVPFNNAGIGAPAMPLEEHTGAASRNISRTPSPPSCASATRCAGSPNPLVQRSPSALAASPPALAAPTAPGTAPQPPGGPLYQRPAHGIIGA